MKDRTITLTESSVASSDYSNMNEIIDLRAAGLSSKDDLNTSKKRTISDHKIWTGEKVQEITAQEVALATTQQVNNKKKKWVILR